MTPGMWESLAVGFGLFGGVLAAGFYAQARRLNRVRRTDRWRGDAE